LHPEGGGVAPTVESFVSAAVFSNRATADCEVCIAAAIPVWERLNRTRTHDLLHGKQFVDPSFQH